MNKIKKLRHKSNRVTLSKKEIKKTFKILRILDENVRNKFLSYRLMNKKRDLTNQHIRFLTDGVTSQTESSGFNNA